MHIDKGTDIQTRTAGGEKRNIGCYKKIGLSFIGDIGEGEWLRG